MSEHLLGEHPFAYCVQSHTDSFGYDLTSDETHPKLVLSVGSRHERKDNE